MSRVPTAIDGFRPEPLKPSYKRRKKTLPQILNWDHLRPENVMSDAEIDEWIRTTRHKVMYRDESRVD